MPQGTRLKRNVMGNQFGKDLIKLIAEEIDTESAWHSFVLINKQTALIGHEMGERKKEYFWQQYLDELFKDIE